MFTHTDFKFDEIKTEQVNGKRHYVTPKGKFPSITTVLSILSRKGIAEWRARVGEKEANRVSTTAARRGTNVHLMCEQYVNNELDVSKFMPHEKAMFYSIKPILNGNINNVVAQEVPLWSSYLGVAGRVDCIAEYNGILSIIDFKTSTKERNDQWNENYYIQCAAYAEMYGERTGTEIEQIVILCVTEDGTVQEFVKQKYDYLDALEETASEWRKKNETPSTSNGGVSVNGLSNQQ